MTTEQRAEFLRSLDELMADTDPAHIRVTIERGQELDAAKSLETRWECWRPTAGVTVTVELNGGAKTFRHGL